MFCSLNISCFALVSNAWFIRCRVCVKSLIQHISISLQELQRRPKNKLNNTKRHLISEFWLHLKQEHKRWHDWHFIRPYRSRPFLFFVYNFYDPNAWTIIESFLSTVQYSTVDNVWINFYSNSILRGIISFAKHVEACVHNLKFGVF